MPSSEDVPLRLLHLTSWLHEGVIVAMNGGIAAGTTLTRLVTGTHETECSLAWTHTKPTLNLTNTHTPISISAEGSKEFNSTCALTVSQQISRTLSQWPNATWSNQQYLKFSLFLLWSFLQESTEYHATLKAKTFIIYTNGHTDPRKWHSPHSELTKYESPLGPTAHDFAFFLAR